MRFAPGRTQNVISDNASSRPVRWPVSVVGRPANQIKVRTISTQQRATRMRGFAQQIDVTGTTLIFQFVRNDLGIAATIFHSDDANYTQL